MTAALPEVMPVAVYLGPGRVEVERRPVPEPAAGEVLVEVGHCGVCGSDLHLVMEGWGKPGTVAGHEWSGTVRLVGADAGRWSPGDVVVGGPSPRCGRCRRCVEGQPSQCERRGEQVHEHTAGAFARFVVADARALCAVPDGLAARTAALAEPLAVALHAITRARLVPGDSVMVFGAGPIGALAVAALVARGDHRVTVVEPGPARRALARKLGADVVVEPAELEQFPAWEPERLAPDPVDAVLECSGKKAGVEAGLHQLRRGGRLVLVGAGMEQPVIDPNRVLLNELEISGSFVYDADGIERALELLRSGALPTDVLIEPDDATLDTLGDVMHGLARGDIAAKVLVVPRAAEEVRS